MRTARRRLREFQPAGGERLPTPSEVKSIKDFLRPNFEMVLSTSASIGNTEARLLSLTQEQYDRLDELEMNPRCLFEGAAGTGKTLLSLEHAKRAERSGARVLLVCFNRLLGEWFRQQARDTKITAGTFHEIAEQFIMTGSAAGAFRNESGEALKDGDTDRLFRELYPFHGQMALEERKAAAGSPFDLLVVDEAQDLCARNYLDFLDLAIHDCLAGGRWTMFGDFTRQALYGNAIDPAGVLSRYSGHFVRARLTHNCRNTRRISEETAVLAGFEKPPSRSGQETGLPVEYRYWKEPSDLVESLTGVLGNLRREKISVDSIILLSPHRLENSSLVGIERIAGFPLMDISDRERNRPGGMKRQLNALKFSTVHAFKGLESQVVIVTDIDGVEREGQQSLLYVGMSRARSLLILMINERARKAVEFRRKAVEGKLRHE